MPIALALAMRRQLACSAHSSLTSRANRHLWCSWLCRLRRVSLRFDIRIAAWAPGRWDHGCRARVRHGWPDRHVRIEARGRADHALGPTQPLTQAFARRGRAGRTWILARVQRRAAVWGGLSRGRRLGADNRCAQTGNNRDNAQNEYAPMRSRRHPFVSGSAGQ